MYLSVPSDLLAKQAELTEQYLLAFLYSVTGDQHLDQKGCTGGKQKYLHHIQTHSTYSSHT